MKTHIILLACCLLISSSVHSSRLMRFARDGHCSSVYIKPALDPDFSLQFTITDSSCTYTDSMKIEVEGRWSSLKKDYYLNEHNGVGNLDLLKFIPQGYVLQNYAIISTADYSYNPLLFGVLFGGSRFKIIAFITCIPS